MTLAPSVLAPVRLQFYVVGIPEPQGSARAFVNPKTHRATITSDNPHLRKWRKTIAAAGLGLLDAPSTEPVHVTAVFRMPRPKSTPKHILYPAVIPDLDKLCRALLDGLVDGRLLKSDQQVVVLTASKVYAADGQLPGVAVKLEVLPGRA